MAAGAHGGVDGFEVGAGFGVDPAGEAAHAVGALWSQVESTAAGAVVLVEEAVGVEVIGDAPADLLDECGVLTLGVADQDSFGYVSFLCSGTAEGSTSRARRPRRCGRRRPGRPRRRRPGVVARAAVRGRSGCGADGCGRRCAIRRCDLAGGDAQPLPQQLAHHGACGQIGIVGSVGGFGDFAEDPVHLPAVDAVLGLQSFGHLDAERVTDRIRGRRSQPGVTRVDLIKCGADLVSLRIHATHIIRTHVRTAIAGSPPVHELPTVDNGTVYRSRRHL